MEGLIAPAIVGVICIVLGIMNVRGNISTLHSYHTHRVSEQDRLPFGRLVGIGTMLIGASILIFNVFLGMAIMLEASLYTVIGSVILTVGITAGIVFTIYALLKYNKGIF